MQNNEFTVNILNADQLYVEGKRIQQLDLGTLVSSDTGNGYGIGIKTDKPRVTFDISGTDGLRIPFGNTSSRPQNIRFTGTAGESTDYKGVIRYNTETEKYESWLGTNAQTSWGRFVIEDEDYYTTDISSNILIRGNHTIWGINGDENNSSGNLTLRAGGTIDKQGQVNYIGTNISNADKSSKITLTGGNSTNISLTTANQDRMIIDSNGKIGIGVTSPVHNVDISANQTMVTNSTSIQSKVITNSAFDSKNITNNNMYLMLQHGTGNSSGGIFSGIARNDMGGFSLGVKKDNSIKNIINANSEGFMNINIGQNIHDDKLFLAPYVFGFNPALTTSKFVKFDNNKSNNSNLFISNMEFTTSTQQTNFGKNGVFIGKGCTLYSDTTNNPELLIFGDNPISNGGATPQSNGGGILLSDKMRFVTYKDTSFVADSGITSHLGQAISHSKKLQLNSVTRMVIDKDGKVGIGTDNPVTRLQIGNLDNFHEGHMQHGGWDQNALTIIHQTPTGSDILNDPKPVLYLGRKGTGSQAYGALATFCISRWEHVGSSGGYSARTRMDIKLDHDITGGNAKTVMTMRSDGNVGIGTADPQAELDVKASEKTTGTAATLRETAGINFSTDNGNNSWSVGYIGGYIAAGVNNDTGNYPGGLLFRTRSPHPQNQPGTISPDVRMVINAIGNVGIGTTNPLTRLQIGNLDNFQAGSMTNNRWDSNALTIIHQTPTTSTILNDPKPVLYLGRDGTSGQAFGALATFCISRWEHAGTNNVGARTRMDIKLDHDQTGENTPTVMTMRSDGRIGIGINNPLKKLHVKDGRIRIEGGTNIDKSGVLELANDAGTASYIFSERSDNSILAGNLFIRSHLNTILDSVNGNGNVGIGETSPNKKLHIKGDGGSSAAIKIQSTNSGGAGFMYIQRNTNGTSYVLTDNHPLILATNNSTGSSANQLYLKGDGKVGIGTDEPLANLDVNDTSLFRGEMRWRYQNSGNTSHALHGNKQDWYIRSGNSSGIVVLQDLGGNVCIGSGTPTEKLYVNGNIYSTGFVRGNSAGSLLKSYYYRNIETSNSEITKKMPSDYLTVVEKTVTPSATGVRFKVSFDCNYDVNGWGTDSYISRIMAKQDNNETAIMFKRQRWWGGNNGTGTRSSVLFPIIGVFYTTSTTSVEFRVEIHAEGSRNDWITIYRQNGVAFIIEEIKA